MVHVVNGIAVPTTEWRLVPKGVACPRGCEYQMDLAAGTNMIRLPSSTSENSNRGALVPAKPSTSAARDSDEVIVLEESPSPQRAKTAATQVNGDKVLDTRQRAAAAVAGKAVDRQHRQRKVATKKDGSREEACMAVRSRELIRPGRREKLTKRADARVRKLKDGTTVITETLTLQKITILPK